MTSESKLNVNLLEREAAEGSENVSEMVTSTSSNVTSRRSPQQQQVLQQQRSQVRSPPLPLDQLLAQEEQGQFFNILILISSPELTLISFD